MVDECESRTARQHQQATTSRHSHAHLPSREELQRQVERQQREIEKLREQVADRDRQIADAEEQIADLERQLASRQKNSTNSSKPPSSDGLAGNSRQRGRRKKSKRKVGGQKGHPGHHRPLVPPAQVQEVRPVLPEECKHCGHALSQQPEQMQTVGEVQRHQVTELPPIQPYVIEYQCPRWSARPVGKAREHPCRKRRRGLRTATDGADRLPDDLLPPAAAGGGGVSGTRAGHLYESGQHPKVLEQASAAVSQPCQELEQQLKNEPVLNSDETGWRNNGEKRYLWALWPATSSSTRWPRRAVPQS